MTTCPDCSVGTPAEPLAKPNITLFETAESRTVIGRATPPTVSVGYALPNEIASPARACVLEAASCSWLGFDAEAIAKYTEPGTSPGTVAPLALVKYTAAPVTNGTTSGKISESVVKSTASEGLNSTSGRSARFSPATPDDTCPSTSTWTVAPDSIIANAAPSVPSR